MSMAQKHSLAGGPQSTRRMALTNAIGDDLFMPHSADQSKLESRVIRAAETALSHQHYVSAIDVLCGMGLLHAEQVDLWRKGRVDFLERVIQGNLSKISSSMAIFRRWAREKVSSRAKLPTCVERGVEHCRYDSARVETPRS